MSSYIQKKEEQLKLILPENYEYHIHGVSVKESGNVPSEVKLEAHFRVTILKSVGNMSSSGAVFKYMYL